MGKLLNLQFILVMFLFLGYSNCFAQGSAGKKILIVYFSWSGNTKEVAKAIQQSVGGTLFEVKTLKDYPKDYNACIEYAKQEQKENTRPKISGDVNDISSYDTIFIGYPNWWGTIPMPLFTFLEKYNLSGKTVIPFCTHGGGGAGRGFDDIRKLCPSSKFLEGIAISGSRAANSLKDIEAWVKKIGVKK
ncbi:MAG: NAD(P)H-dependent oxidoreductase [Elusimicrobiota bacterium]|jgi:flavodoxin|nr:NAD(P)H-dependent oxidoreductase [Elusimicrobiota bacterium]